MANATGKTYVNVNTAGGHDSHIVLTADTSNAFSNATRVVDPVKENPDHGGRWRPENPPHVGGASSEKLFIKLKCTVTPKVKVRGLDTIPDAGNLSITLTDGTASPPTVTPVPVAYTDNPNP
jgi:hypothetical protein